MAILDGVRQLAANLLIERPVRRKSMTEIATQLESSGSTIAERAASAQDNVAKNRETMQHIIGIERWGQRRLRGFLGDAPPQDEYDGYRPDALTGLTELRQAFLSTRAETVALAQKIAQTGATDATTITHNGFGPLSARGWLRYLTMHANLESKRLR